MPAACLRKSRFPAIETRGGWCQAATHGSVLLAGGQEVAAESPRPSPSPRQQVASDRGASRAGPPRTLGSLTQQGRSGVPRKRGVPDAEWGGYTWGGVSTAGKWMICRRSRPSWEGTLKFKSAQLTCRYGAF